MGLADGDDAGAEGAEWSGSGEAEAAAVLTVVLEGWAEDTAMVGATGNVSVKGQGHTYLVLCDLTEFCDVIIYASRQVMTLKVLLIKHYSHIQAQPFLLTVKQSVPSIWKL